MTYLNALLMRAAKGEGFTLVETLLAVLLLATAIAGPLTLASKGLTATVVARDQMTAFYLAQDAVEYVRYLRDSNKLGGSPWLTGLSPCVSSDGSATCYIDPSPPNTTTACPSGVCPALNKQVSGGSTFFTYAGGTQTPQNFVRTISITDQTTEAILVVSVSWRAPSGVTRIITVRENIFDWQ